MTKLLFSFLRVLGAFVGFFFLVFFIRIIALAGVVESIYIENLYYLMGEFVLIPSIILGVVALALSYTTRGKYTWWEYVTTQKDGDVLIKFTNTSILMVLFYIFFWPLLKAFLFISM